MSAAYDPPSQAHATEAARNHSCDSGATVGERNHDSRSPGLLRASTVTEIHDAARLPWLLQDTLGRTHQQVNDLAEGRITATHNAYTAAPTTGTYAQGDYIRNSAPAVAGSASSKYVIVFFDEMDALFRTRGTGISSDIESTIVPEDPSARV